MMKDIVISKEKTDFNELIEKNKEYIYLLLFYISGLLTGSLLFNSLNLSEYSSYISDLLTIKNDSLLSITVDRLSLYFFVYVFAILLGLCIIGFPIINFLPLLCGFEVAIKIAFYYNLYSIKGIGYSFLMIAPETAAFMVILFFTISASKKLSKNIFTTSIQKDIENQIILTDYLKLFLKYGAEIIIISFVNSLIIYLFNSIIKI